MPAIPRRYDDSLMGLRNIYSGVGEPSISSTTYFCNEYNQNESPDRKARFAETNCRTL